MAEHKPIPDDIEKLAKEAVNAAFRVHNALGPGLLESVYEACLAYEIRKQGSEVKNQVVFPVVYEQIRLDAGLRIDLLVNDKLIIEVKSVEMLLPIHDAQLITYLRLTNRRLGLLINFNVKRIKMGIKRMVL
jgi:GxxExxY protein